MAKKTFIEKLLHLAESEQKPKKRRRVSESDMASQIYRQVKKKKTEKKAKKRKKQVKRAKKKVLKAKQKKTVEKKAEKTDIRAIEKEIMPFVVKEKK